MSDMLRLAGGVIAIIGIGALLFNDQLGLSESEANAVAFVAVIALVIIFVVRFFNYRKRQQELTEADDIES